MGLTTYLLLSTFILNGVWALPAKYPESEAIKDDTCIVITPEKEKEIESIVFKLSEFLYNLTTEHDDFDIRLLKMVVEGYSPYKPRQRDIQVELEVNDCANTDEENNHDLKYDEDDVAKTDDKSTNEVTKTAEAKSAIDQDTEIDQETSINDKSTAKANEEATVDKKISSNDDGEDSSAKEAPQLMLLDLDETGKELVDLYEAKHGKTPLLLYVTKVLDSLQYLFLN